jgi:ACT domain-containing protein
MSYSDWFAISIILSLQTIGSLLSVLIGIYLVKYHNNLGTPSNIKLNNTNHNRNNQTKKLDIDETKVVLNIDTTKLEKKFTNLAEQKIVDTDISESVNRLKQMKG